MNRTTWTRFLLAASLALNLGIVVAIAIRPSPPRSVDIAVQPPHLNLQDYLELSVEQRTKWQQLEPAFLHELAVNWQGIRQHREALVQQIFATTPNRTAIDAEQAAIAALQGAQQQRVIAQLLAERNLLDEQQRKRLMDLLLSRYSQETTEEELLHRD
ncbi:Spy/CpxP family protein refolding chaperone [Candidatus Aalborgicola defluviihabitans]|uniref:Spy/CpxP family protein refolding chaperone n=1 Tax=Candidatus Aalborgicola defluviihabitans TaxID=3386187 RepID=UPI0039095B35|nr:periplasmic heavy metal sensor [Burkholderiales bacterium]